MEKEFFDFVYKRQIIWHKRFVLREKPPWSSDPVFQKYKILNVYRELDKGTIYIINKLKNITNRKTILLNVVFYRFFNKYKLYEELDIEPITIFTPELIKNILKGFENLRRQGKPLFNDAYIIAGVKNKEKHVSVLEILSNLNIERLIEKIDKSKTPEKSFEVIKEIPLVGNFLAYEIWTDLTYFDFFRQKWSDNDFVNVGPGAKWGLEIIYGDLNKKQALEKLNRLYKIQKDFLLLMKNPSWKEILYKKAFGKTPFFSLRNIEHSLCEFRKYHNLKRGGGKKRRFYPSKNLSDPPKNISPRFFVHPSY